MTKYINNNKGAGTQVTRRNGTTAQCECLGCGILNEMVCAEGPKHESEGAGSKCSPWAKCPILGVRRDFRESDTFESRGFEVTLQSLQGVTQFPSARP